MKCFEVANSLADTVLYTPTALAQPGLQLRPQDFLHALYQKLLPFLEQDPMLKSILHTKTAEVLVQSPARLLSLGFVGEEYVEEDTPEKANFDLDYPVDNLYQIPDPAELDESILDSLSQTPGGHRSLNPDC